MPLRGSLVMFIYLFASDVDRYMGRVCHNITPLLDFSYNLCAFVIVLLGKLSVCVSRSLSIINKHLHPLVCPPPCLFAPSWLQRRCLLSHGTRTCAVSAHDLACWHTQVHISCRKPPAAHSLCTLVAGTFSPSPSPFPSSSVWPDIGSKATLLEFHLSETLSVSKWLIVRLISCGHKSKFIMWYGKNTCALHCILYFNKIWNFSNYLNIFEFHS